MSSGGRYDSALVACCSQVLQGAAGVVGRGVGKKHAAGLLVGPQQRGVPGAVPDHGAAMTVMLRRFCETTIDSLSGVLVGVPCFGLGVKSLDTGSDVQTTCAMGVCGGHSLGAAWLHCLRRTAVSSHFQANFPEHGGRKQDVGCGAHACRQTASLIFVRLQRVVKVERCVVCLSSEKVQHAP